MALNILWVSTSFLRGGTGKQVMSLTKKINRSKYNFNYYSASDSKLLINLRMGLSALLGSDQIFGQDLTKLDLYKHSDIVHLHNLHGGYFKLSTLERITKEKKVVWTLHDLWAIHGKSPGVDDEYVRFDYPPMLIDTTKLLLKQKAEIYRKCKNLHLVVPSKWMAKQLVGSILEQFPVTVIPNGVDTDKYKPSDKSKLKKQLGLKGNVALIVASGGVYNQAKGGSEMLELSRAIPSLTFVIIGGKDGPKLPNVKYVSELGKDQLIPYYQAADLFVSLSHAESFGLSIVEAQSSATPAFAYDAGAVSEVVFDQNHLVKLGDLNKLVKMIESYLAMSNQAKEAEGVAAREFVLKNYTLQKMVSGYERLYSSL